MKLSENLRKEYREILNKNGVAEREFKQLFRDKEPYLKFKVDDDLENVTFYIGYDKSPYMFDLTKIKLDSILKSSAYNNYDTVQVILLAIYCMDRLVGEGRNKIRNMPVKELDKGIGNQVIEYIISRPELLCKIFKKYTGINFEILNVNYDEIPQEVLDKHPWLAEKIFMIFNENIFFVTPFEKALEYALKIFDADFIPLKDFQRVSGSLFDLNVLIQIYGYNKLLLTD